MEMQDQVRDRWWNAYTSVNNGHTGGASFSAPSFKDEPLTTMAEAMATPHFGQAYMPTAFNALAALELTSKGWNRPPVCWSSW